MSKICKICGKKPSMGRSISRRGMAKKKGGVVRAKAKRAVKPRAKAKSANRIKASSDHKFSY